MAKSRSTLVKRTRQEEVEHPPTYLSNYVHNILVDLPKNVSTCGYENTLTDEALFNWTEIKNILRLPDDLVIFDQPLEWFKDKLVLIWGIIHAAGKTFMKITPEKRAKLLSCLPKISDPSVDRSPAARLETTLIVTAAFERFLGNVYQSYCSRPVPFLLRDLLATDEISEVFGSIPVTFSQFLAGCVSGLNVRNISWHGFFSENELHINLVSCLIILFASMADITNSKQLNNHQRPPVNLIARSGILLNFFPDLREKENETIEYLDRSKLVNPVQRIYWERILQSFKSERYGECLVMMLPQLEQSLRTYFCPSNLLCAQPSEFYVTLDQIISVVPSAIDDESCTVSDVLGENLLEMLRDAFVYMDGPRIRDKISHGEVDLQDINHALCNHVLSMALGVMMVLSQEEGVIEQCLLETYLSRAHPSSCLRRVMDTGLVCLLNWPDLESTGIIESSDVLSLRYTVYDLFDIQHCSSLRDVLKQMQDFVNKDYFLRLHRLNLDTSAVSQARKLVSYFQAISERITEAYHFGKDRCDTRPRHRKTYERMIAILPQLRTTLFAILATLVFVLTQPAVFSSDHHKRLLKSGIKFVENVLSLCHKEKNRWLEIEQLTNNISSQYSYYINKNIELVKKL
ncbi:endoplasmic reticulum membrane-associated RNA degradation protein [Nilaparvata lugens]|uniref:endoplasmic reticulum membrane-associated RNA degradation protein n=1 Tax=Nilaparvata lugens TaxID=108931 RepID=UPI00193D1BF8|nr:endoplasmic reticulum membrane-associated RNA degradation protein [Nilaparvata lugens]